MKKRLLTLGLVFGLMSTAFCGCGAKENSDTSAQETRKEPASLSEVYTQITKNVEFVPLVKIDDKDYIYNAYGVEMDKITDMEFYVADDYLKADACVLLKTSSEADAKDAKASLDNYIKNKKTELEDYLPQEFAKVEDACVGTEGSYVYMFIGDNAQDAEKEFKSFF